MDSAGHLVHLSLCPGRADAKNDTIRAIGSYRLSRSVIGMEALDALRPDTQNRRELYLFCASARTAASVRGRLPRGPNVTFVH
jgi:hypothetical protein